MDLEVRMHPLGITSSITPVFAARLARAVRWELILTVALLLMLCAGMAACQQTPPENRLTGVSLTGIDHLPDHLSVQHFTVDGADGFQAGKGGSIVCCAMLPLHWYPGLTVKVTWKITNWRDCSGEDREAVVPVTAYDHPGHVYVHFMTDGSVHVISTDKGILAPDYPGPHDPIPPKEPWKVWPSTVHCKHLYSDDVLIP